MTHSALRVLTDVEISYGHKPEYKQLVSYPVFIQEVSMCPHKHFLGTEERGVLSMAKTGTSEADIREIPLIPATYVQ